MLLRAQIAISLLQKKFFKKAHLWKTKEERKMNKSAHRIDFSFLENMEEGTEHYEIMDIL